MGTSTNRGCWWFVDGPFGVTASASILGADQTAAGLRRGVVFTRALPPCPRAEFSSGALEHAEPNRLSVLRWTPRESRTARSRRTSVSSRPFSDLTSLSSPLRSPAPPLNGFRRLGSRQSGKRLSRPRHWLQPTAAPARYLSRYGLLWLRRSRDNRGREEWRQTA